MNKRAPVFFTIAALRHEPLLTLPTLFPLIQDELRHKGFDGHVEQKITLDTGEASFMLFSGDKRQAFTFNSKGVFAFHTVAYEDKTRLFASFRLGLETLHKRAFLSSMKRVGVRMLDVWIPGK